MKLVNCLYDNRKRIGIIEKDIINLLPFDFNMVEFIKIYSYLDLNKLYENLKPINIKNVKLLAPIEKSINDIICVGKNYVEHIEEIDDILPSNSDKATYFGKRANKILGINEDIKARFDLDDQVDYEVELAVIIGKKCKNISEDEALEYIFGYSIFNDISSRGLQKNHNQWYLGKGLDNYSVMGPCIVTKDELDYKNLSIKSYIDNELRQFSNTNKMIFEIPYIISELSKGITLYPGDIIATGTPSGVGLGFNPPKFLKKGSRIRCEIEGIGSLCNRVI